MVKKRNTKNIETDDFDINAVMPSPVRRHSEEIEKPTNIKELILNKIKSNTENKTTKDIILNTDISETFKNMIFDVSSIPMQPKSKKDKLKTHLENDKFLNEYLEKYLYINYLNKVNNHIKAGLIYGYYFQKVKNEL